MWHYSRMIKLVGEYTIHNKKTHSQTLLPMIHDMLEMADVSVKELDAIAIARRTRFFYRASVSEQQLQKD